VTERSGRHSHERLGDILAAVSRAKQAERHMVVAEAANDEDAINMAFDAILYNLVVMGEAVNALPPELIATRPDIPWRDIVDMRNFLSHEYFACWSTSCAEPSTNHSTNCAWCVSSYWRIKEQATISSCAYFGRKTTAPGRTAPPAAAGWLTWPCAPSSPVGGSQSPPLTMEPGWFGASPWPRD